MISRILFGAAVPALHVLPANTPAIEAFALALFAAGVVSLGMALGFLGKATAGDVDSFLLKRR